MAVPIEKCLPSAKIADADGTTKTEDDITKMKFADSENMKYHKEIDSEASRSESVKELKADVSNISSTNLCEPNSECSPTRMQKYEMETEDSKAKEVT